MSEETVGRFASVTFSMGDESRVIRIPPEAEWVTIAMANGKTIAVDADGDIAARASRRNEAGPDDGSEDTGQLPEQHHSVASIIIRAGQRAQFGDGEIQVNPKDSGGP